MPNIRKLAELAGVSIATVSRALNNASRIAPETRDRILTLAAEHHYHRNRAASSLWTGTSRTIGCLVPHLGVPFSARIVRGVIEAADALDLHVIVGETRQSVDTITMRIHRMVEQRVDGVILFSGCDDTLPKSALLELWSHDITTVFLDRMPCEVPVCRVVDSQSNSINVAINYLVTLGHRRIAAISLGDEKNIRTLLTARGLTTRYVTDAQAIADTDAYFLNTLMGTAGAPTAVFCPDGFAATLLEIARAHGVVIPSDLSVLGLGNDHMCNTTFPHLTSVELCPEDLGHQALALIQERRAAKIAPHMETGIFPLAAEPFVVERTSCGPPQLKVRRRRP